jgi:hypothetical protein
MRRDARGRTDEDGARPGAARGSVSPSMTDDPRDILLSLAARISAAVLDRLGKDDVVTVFVSGGAARGEVAAFRGSSGVEIYSDLDLFVIIRHGADLERARSEARRAATEVPLVGDGFVVFPEPDIGVFTKEDFLSQKTRPGTVEIAGSHVALHGDAEIPALARKFRASEIEPAEALYLVENRLLEMCALADRLDKTAGDGFRRYARYVLLKSSFDAAASVLIALGRFHPSRAERVRRIQDAVSSGECFRLLPEDACGRVASWYGELSDLQGALEKSGPPDRPAFEEAARILLENWRRTASYISGLSTVDWNALFEWRCKARRWVGNARELSALARRRSVPRIRVLRRAGSLARLSPVDSLRLSGAARMLLRYETTGGAPRASFAPGMTDGYMDVVGGLTRAFGYSEGDVFERARRMFEDTR